MGFGALQGVTALRAASAYRLFPTTDAENALSSIWAPAESSYICLSQGITPWDASLVD